MVDFRSFNEVQQRNVLVLEGGREDFVGGLELVFEKFVIQFVFLQVDVGLDLIEEKILFGNDESIWEVFGLLLYIGIGGVNRIDGIWSVFMQLVVVEIFSNDVGVQEEWSGLGFQNLRLQFGYQLFRDCEK